MEYLSHPFTANVEILAPSFQTLEFWPVLFTHIIFLILAFKTLGFWPYFYKHWNYYLILTNFDILRNIAVLALSVYTWKVLSYRSKPWNFGAVLMRMGILTSSFQAQEFWPYFCEQRNSHLTLPSTGILALFLYTLVFWCYLSKPWDPGLIYKSTGIMILSLRTLDFWPYFIHSWIVISSYPSKDWYSDLLPSIRILVLLLKTLQFLCYSSTANIGILILSLKTLWFWAFIINIGILIWLIFPHVGILVLFLETLGSWPYLSKHWNYSPIFLSIEILALF